MKCSHRKGIFMGDAINHFFESQMQWYFDNGIFYINGRDIVCIITGICIGILFALFVELFKYLFEGRKK